MKVKLSKNADKFLDKLTINKQVLKIMQFLDTLEKEANPTKMSNCKKIESASDNRWRWRVGEYRIIGVIEKDNDIKIILIIKIDKKDDNTYK